MTRFTDEVEEYAILRLVLSRYSGTHRPLPDGFRIAGDDVRRLVRERERDLLKARFLSWTLPYYGKLTGWRQDSPLYLMHQDKLVGGVYLCETDELHQAGFGQLHYAFMDDDYRGKGLYSALFAESVQRARSWGLEGLTLNSDRYMLPEVYLRWGAEPHLRRHKPRNPLMRAARRVVRQTRNWFLILRHRHDSPAPSATPEPITEQQ